MGRARTLPGRCGWRAAVAVALLLGLFAVVAPAGADAAGLVLSKHNCVSNGGTGGNCTSGPGLVSASDVVISPDGRFAYATASGSDAVTVFDRGADGNLTQKAGHAGCISDSGSGGACVDGRALDGAAGIAMSRDGATVYVASSDSDGIAVFDRAANGMLTQKPGTAGCFTDDGTGGTCGNGAGLSSSRAVTVSPDGQNVYVAADSVVVTLNRSANGALTQPVGLAACTSDDSTTASGDFCTDGVGLTNAFDVEVSPDGTSVYVTWLSGVSVFSRAADGRLTQKLGTAGCVSDDGAANGDPGVCVDGNAINGARSIAISPDGTNAYVAAGTSDAVAVFDRAADGTLTQKGGAAGCVEHTAAAHSCTQGVSLQGAWGLAFSPDGKRLYVSSEASGAVTTHDRAADGTLTPRPSACIVKSPAVTLCRQTSSSDGASGLAASPDGKQLLVTGLRADAVLAIDVGERVVTTLGETVERTGTTGCVQLMGTPMAASCSQARPSWPTFAGLWLSTISADGKHVYAASQAGALLVFDRAQDGTLTQKAGTAGCVSEDGSGGDCADGRGLVGALDVALSADGKSVYVTTIGSNSIAVFDRAADGTVMQKAGTAGCISEDGSGGECVDGKALTIATDVAVSTDGTSVIVVSDTSKAVAVFDRASDGGLTQKLGTAGCISDDGSGGDCTDARALDAPTAAIISRDGRHVYVVSSVSDSVSVFDRAGDGTLTQKLGTAGCVSDDGSGGDCVDGKALDDASGVSESFDGKQVYVVSKDGDAVAVFDRGTDGALTQKSGTAGCVSESGNAGDCADGTNLRGAAFVTPSADGRNVYVSSAGGLVVLDRAVDGTLTQKPLQGGCIAGALGGVNGGDGACELSEVISVPGVTLSPDGKHLYAGTSAVGRIVLFERYIPPPAPPVTGDPATGGTGATVDPGAAGTGGPGPPPGPGELPGSGVALPTADTIKPRLSRFSFAAKRFVALTKGASIVTKGGTAFRYTLSEAAAVAFTVEREGKGRRSGSRCVKPTRKNRRAKSCKRFTKLRGSFKHGGKLGKNAVRFSGRVASRKLSPGRYRLVLVATDAAGNRSVAVTVSFQIRAAPSRR